LLAFVIQQAIDIVLPFERAGVIEELARLGNVRNAPLQIEERAAEKGRVIDRLGRRDTGLFVLRVKTLVDPPARSCVVIFVRDAAPPAGGSAAGSLAAS
jgi:hypothetical protein